MFAKSDTGTAVLGEIRREPHEGSRREAATVAKKPNSFLLQTDRRPMRRVRAGIAFGPPSRHTAYGVTRFVLWDESQALQPGPLSRMPTTFSRHRRSQCIANHRDAGIEIAAVEAATSLP